MNNILIVDGHNLLFQAFYGIPTKVIKFRNKTQITKECCMGFCGSLNKLINLIKPTHLIVLFDGKIENSRKSLLASYKANRDDYSQMPDEENPLLNLQKVYKCLDFLTIKYVIATDGEADDIIASYCFKYGSENKIWISSHDNDFYQLISENINIIQYRGKRQKSEIINVESFVNKYSFSPELYVEYKAMVGDKSDNIKGIRGIGHKMAVQIINTYGSVKNIFDNAIEKDDEVIKNIIKNKKIFQRNCSLINLDKHCIIPMDLEEIKFQKRNVKIREIICMIE